MDYEKKKTKLQIKKENIVISLTLFEHFNFN